MGTIGKGAGKERESGRLARESWCQKGSYDGISRGK